MVWSRGSRVRAICIVSVYLPIATLWQAIFPIEQSFPNSAGAYPLPGSGRPSQARPKTEARPAGLLGSLTRNTMQASLTGHRKTRKDEKSGQQRIENSK